MVTSMRPPQPQAITKISISALVISLPILYVSLLRLPPYTLAGDTTFWFLMSNSIITIIAADSGMLFFSSTSHDDDDVPGDQPAVAVQDSFGVTSAPLMSSDEPTKMDISDVVGGEQLRNDGVASCNTTSTDVDHALVLQRCEEEEAAAVEPSTDNKNYAMIMKVEEEVAIDPNKLTVEDQMLITPPAASEDGGDVANELAIIDHHNYASSETEPWRPGLVTSKSLVEEAEEDQWPIPHPRITPYDDDAPQGKSTVVAREEKPWCSATEGSRPPEEGEYWQLSNEELNRKVEEFITRFNRDMIEQEAGV